MGITQSITINGLTPGQICDLQHFVNQVLIGGQPWDVRRTDDVRRTADEIASATPPLAPPPAPAAAPSPAPAAVSVPVVLNGHAAAPGASVADDPSRPNAPRDNRGVPHHPDFHAALTSTSGGLKGDGTWKRKRGHDEVAADAYEARYLQPQREAEAATIANPTQVAPATMATPGTAAPHTPSVASGTPAPLAAFPVPPLAPPPPPAAPTQEQLEQLWTELALNNRVGTDHSAYLASWIGWPIVANEAYRLSAENRTTVYNWLSQYR